MTGMDAACARPASGQAIAAPAIDVINSRRLMASLKAQDKALHELRLARGSGCGTSRLGVPPMSPLGHERPGRAGSGSGHVRFAPKATVGHENAIRR